MSLELLPYVPEDAELWDEFCASALQSTLLHTRRFLSYHGESFVDRSLLLKVRGKLVALFPAAISPTDSSCIVSHPGITYGGLLHQGGLRGEELVSTINAIRHHYAMQGRTRLIYKAVPMIYHRASTQDDLYALFRLGAKRTRCDLSSSIALDCRLPVSERRKRSLSRAAKAGVQIISCTGRLQEFWSVLADNLRQKHGASPVHSFDEISALCERFPEEIECVSASIEGHIEAGVLLFRTPVCDHAQYIASSERGRAACALDAVFEHCITAAGEYGKRVFDFGISTEHDGTALNQGLYQFKSEFGAAGVVYEFYELNLNES